MRILPACATLPCCEREMAYDETGCGEPHSRMLIRVLPCWDKPWAGATVTFGPGLACPGLPRLETGWLAS
jgi:hypothetical protein